MFRNRKEAGQILAEHLMGYATQSPAVYALPRGGVPVGYEIARHLDAPLDVIVARKLGAPETPELAIGAIADGAHREIVLNRVIIRHAHLPAHYLKNEARHQVEEIHRSERNFREGRAPVSARGRTAIVVDDGIATGATMRAALRRIRWDRPHRLVLAVPVASEEALEDLMNEADQTVCLVIPETFISVGRNYLDFSPVTDDEVRRLLDQAAFHTRVTRE